MHAFTLAVTQPIKLLRALHGWLDLAETHATERGFSPDAYLGSRLAVDQFAFVRQVQGACDMAKFPAARLTGKTPPSNPDTEATFAELRARVTSTIAYLETFTAEDFAGSEERRVELPRTEGKGLIGAAYLVEFAQPNFYFHLTHAYALLRKDGVPLGKMAYLGGLALS